ncbi:MAG: type II toxin-antitoxin system RelE/ParE family toxin [Deltaproteobacteria bacterium]|jgi:putative addiction module killer protein|nr:type II toxin-antitoxin system RelE/ParE family toxin [Deltaproteobacteria bacterium]
MIIEKTEIFEKWLKRLKDEQAKGCINIKIKRIETENYFGDCRSVGDGIFELRIFVGPGYRIYFYYKDERVIMLLCGGNKKTQKRDIKTAKQILKGEYKL